MLDNDIRLYKINKINKILQNKNLILIEKQYRIEECLNFPIIYKDLLEIYDKNHIFIKHYEELYKKLVEIDYKKVIGKTIFKKFFKIFPLELLNNLILESLLFIISGISSKSGGAVKDFLKTCIIYKIFENKLIIEYNELLLRYNANFTIPKKIKKKGNINMNEYLDGIINLINHSCMYIVENLKIHKIIKWDEYYRIYKLVDLEIDLLTLIILKNKKWPLICKPNNYKYNDYFKEYQGGYYINKLNLFFKNYHVKSIEITTEGLNLLNSYQQTKYYLIKNEKIIEILIYYENYIKEILKKNGLQKSYYFKSYYKDKEIKIIMDDIVEIKLEDWYAIYQYLTYIRNGIKEIYYPYKIDYKGRIYNGIEFGLNPTTNKLSRFLVGFGEYELTKKGKTYLKEYLYKVLKIKTDKEFEIKCEYIQNDINNGYKKLIKENIKEYILVIDWLTNVEINNKTEILVELDATQSGFQMLSMFANDYKSMINTNLIENELNEEKDLYIEILNKLEFSNDIFKTINRDLIKKVIMTIPYGSTLISQKKMILEMLDKQYGIKDLLNVYKIKKLLDSKIITDEFFINEIKEILKDIESKSLCTIKNLKITNCVKSLNSYLFSGFVDNLVKQINKILNQEYKKIIEFVKNLQKKSKDDNFNIIETDYYKFELNYYKVKKKILKVNNIKYSTYYINKEEKDLKKKQKAIVANICQGLGDVFIIYNIILNTNNIYTIHDAILCKSNEIDEKQIVINKSYNYVYNFIIKNDIFNYKKIKIYNINSNKIFKIKGN